MTARPRVEADDKFLPATSEFIIATKSAKRYFDLDAVREMTDRHAQMLANGDVKHGSFGHDEQRNHNHGKAEYATAGNPAGAPPLDWWKDPAVVVIDRLVRSMCPMRVCRECGEPSRRIVKPTEYDADREDTGRPLQSLGSGHRADRPAANPETLGWSDCNHDSWRPGIVFDPFGQLIIERTEADMTSRYIVGDTREVLATMPDNSVDLIISSPPFLALRSYLPADHPDKGKEIGSEATPGAFLDTLLDIVEECARVLTPHGSLCIELGDTYSGSGGAGGDYDDGGMHEGQPRFKARNDGGQYGYHGARGGTKHNHDERPITGGNGWPEAKSLCLIPQSFAWALSYGRNPFTGRETERWRIRNIVRWCRPNPPVGALGDKYRPATSEMVVACKARDRYFDLDAGREASVRGVFPADSRVRQVTGSRKDDGIANTKPDWGGTSPPLDYWEIPRDDTEALRELASENAALWALLEDAGVAIDPTRFHPATSDLIIATKSRTRYFDLDAVREYNNPQRMDEPSGGRPHMTLGVGNNSAGSNGGEWNPAGAPPLDWWEIPTQPYKGAHYASFPEKLVVKPIKSMCPERVCLECREPSRRITERSEDYAAARAAIGDFNQRDAGQGTSGSRSVLSSAAGRDITSAENVTLGWSDCGHDSWRRGIVLDIFAGSGTTLAVAEGLGRDSIGIDLDSRNADLARERCGMFLSVEYPDSESVA